MTHLPEYIRHHQIDFNKWDNMINTHINGRVYNQSFFLNQFCRWDAIILDDYSAGIPLPISKKIGVRGLLQPNFIQQCLWVGQIPDKRTIAKIWSIIIAKFNYIQFNTNLPFDTDLTDRSNLIIPSEKIHNIESSFSKTLKKNLKKALSKHTIHPKPKPSQTVKIYQKNYGHLAYHLKNADYQKLLNISGNSPEYFVHIHVLHNQNLTACLMFAVGNERAHYILGAPSKIGRNLNSLTVGIYEMIQFCKEHDLTFDFEGSNIPSVRDFYASFGSVNEPFYEVRYAPPIIRFLVDIYKKVFKSN